MIQLQTSAGSVYVRPECVVAIMDFCPDGRQVALGVCVLQTAGGAGIVVGMTKEAAIRALGINYTTAAAEAAPTLKISED